MKNFVDRTEEIETLEQEYLKHGASFVVVYGRRRVGKNALISEFIRGKNALFFLPQKKTSEIISIISSHVWKDIQMVLFPHKRLPAIGIHFLKHL